MSWIAMNDWIEWTTSYGQTEGPIPRVISSVPISILQYLDFLITFIFGEHIEASY